MIDSRYLLSLLVLRNKTQKEVEEKLGIAHSTFWRKMQNGTFSIEEVRQMKNIIPLTMEEVEQIFLAD